eukprot:3556422-Prymnesium_polylepis.1
MQQKTRAVHGTANASRGSGMRCCFCRWHASDEAWPPPLANARRRASAVAALVPQPARRRSSTSQTSTPPARV